MKESAPHRLVPLDWMRGLVMVFMALDPVSAIFNRDRVAEDSYAMGAAGAALFVDSGGPLDFLTRWITHLCAPTFVFLAGSALALSVEKRLERGESSWAIDRHLLVRGTILIGLEVWMSLSSLFPVLEVLYAIGASLLCMILLRRLPSWALVGLAPLWMGAGEWITDAAGLQPKDVPGGLPVVPAWSGLLFVNGLVHTPFTIPAFLWMPQTDVFVSLYPLLPWLVMMMIVRALVFGLEAEAPFQVTGAWVGTAVALVVLYPICRWYRSFKHARPGGVLRFF